MKNSLSAYRCSFCLNAASEAAWYRTYCRTLALWTGLLCFGDYYQIHRQLGQLQSLLLMSFCRWCVGRRAWINHFPFISKYALFQSGGCCCWRPVHSWNACLDFAFSGCCLWQVCWFTFDLKRISINSDDSIDGGWKLFELDFISIANYIEIRRLTFLIQFIFTIFW